MTTQPAELKPFAFQTQQLRVLADEQGNPWFVATDVAAILGYRDALNMTRRLDDDEKGTRKVSTLGGTQNLSVINESGLYSCIIGSNKPEAKKFKKWVTSEVLPSIRKTGRYEAATPFDSIPEQKPFDRFNPNKYRELRKSGKTAVADAYLVECGITPDYVRESLSKVSATPQAALPVLPDNAVPLEQLARQVPMRAEQEDSKFWYVKKDSFADLCGGYDVLTTARALAKLKLLQYDNRELTFYTPVDLMPSRVRTHVYKISKRLEDVGASL